VTHERASKAALRRSAVGIAGEMDRRIRSLPVKNTPRVRAIRREFSRALRAEDGSLVLEVARALRKRHGYRSPSYELILAHPGAFRLLNQEVLEDLGQGLDSWWSVDSFARTLSGPAWREGLIDDDVVLGWTRSPDKWWRRAAVVSTVALNVRSRGGRGDVARTLMVCRLLVNDHEDMVEKGLSWALRELVVHEADAVREFVAAHEGRLGSRVRREVYNKLMTGLKTPKSGSGRASRG
jgi:3-methyladenine DNA glycosylase AlkD